MGTNKEIEKSLEQLDALADDFKKSNAARDEDAENEETKQDLEKADDKDKDEDKAGDDVEKADDKDKDEDNDVEKAAKPDEIVEDDDDKDKPEDDDDETKDENNNEEDNNEKLMDDNEKKGKKADKSGEEAPKDAEEKKDDTDEEDEEDQVTKKSMDEIFQPLYKSAHPGSGAMELIDVFHKSMHIQEEGTDAIEKSVVTLTNSMVPVMQELIKSNDKLAQRVKRLEKSNRQQQATITEQNNAIQKSVQEQHDLAKSQPQPRKSVANYVEKSFDHSAGISGEGSSNLSKAEVLERLTGMATNGDGTVTINDVMNYESTGELRPAVEKLVNN